jgi:hypothetical protein
VPTIPDEFEADQLDQEPYNASDPEAVNRARKKAARYAKSRLRFVEEIMKVKEGRAYIWDILESCNIHGNPVVAGDVNATYFNLGQQNIGKLILMDALQFSDNYTTMVQESKSRK